MTYNDGRQIEAEKFYLTQQELLAQFGALTIDPIPARGFWQYQGTTFEDTLIRYRVDAQETPEVRTFFKSYKETIKERFLQKEIWITSTPIEIY